MSKTNKIISSFSPPSIYFSLIWCTIDTLDMIKSGIDDDYCKEDMLMDLSYLLSESKHAYYNSSFYNLNKISLQVVLKTLFKKYCATINIDYIFIKKIFSLSSKKHVRKEDEYHIRKCMSQIIEN